MTLPENVHREFFLRLGVFGLSFSLLDFIFLFRHSAPRLAETTQVQCLYEPILSSGVVIHHCLKMIRATEEKYSIPELAAWAQKPFWGLGPDALLSGSFDVVVLLVVHAYRLGITLCVRMLQPLLEFLEFAADDPSRAEAWHPCGHLHVLVPSFYCLL